MTGDLFVQARELEYDDGTSWEQLAQRWEAELTVARREIERLKAERAAVVADLRRLADARAADPRLVSAFGRGVTVGYRVAAARFEAGE